MSGGIQIPHPIETLYGHGVSLACGRDGQVLADELHGLFAGDTRVLSTYRFAVGGAAWQLLSRERPGPFTARWNFQNPAVRDPAGEIPAGTLLFTITRRVASLSSNPGHLLWCGLPSRERAARLADRLLQADLFSGWGLRTLSARHPVYNPLSYQCGSVWSFDTALAAAGLWRYGLREEASRLLRSVLEAAAAFEQGRLPEVFGGTDRARGLPLPYEKANVPQAWSAAVPLLAAQLFLGLLPDAPRGRCFLSPWLPEWLSYLDLRRISVGQGRLDVRVSRQGDETVIEHMEAQGIEVVQGTMEAPLGGEPPGARSHRES
jgi:hypothetical protein